MNSPGSYQSLQFVIPARMPAAEAVRDMQPAALQAWLGGLPLANAPEAARQILERLQQSNRARIEPLLRYQAAEALRQPVEALVETINARYLGETVDVLFEEKVKERWKGRTPTNKLVFSESDDDLRGKVMPVKVTWTGPWSMQATLIRQSVPVTLG